MREKREKERREERVRGRCIYTCMRNLFPNITQQRVQLLHKLKLVFRNTLTMQRILFMCCTYNSETTLPPLRYTNVGNAKTNT